MREEDIRPAAIFDRYLALAEEDAEAYFSDSDRCSVYCPACDSQGVPVFSKATFTYEECPQCQSLFVSPRPSKESFDKYYTQSKSSEFWATDFYSKTEEARREKLWKPKAIDTALLIDKFGSPKNRHVVDIGGGYGIFAQEISKVAHVNPIIIEPGPKLAEHCRSKGFFVLEKFLEDVSRRELPVGDKVFVSFELFEHLHSPANFLASLSALMGEKDIFIFTTLSGVGLDIRVLWERSKSVSPPHHLNFFNPTSIVQLLSRADFEVLDVSTPGRLDVDIIKNNQDAIEDKFWRYILENGSAAQLDALQRVITDNLLSSHMRVVCKRATK